MAITNTETNEVNCKVLYLGPSDSGKTENLRAIFRQTSPEVISGTLELDERQDRTKYFNFLPVSMGEVAGYHLRLNLYTFPTHRAFAPLFAQMLKGMDGYVFVADSRMDRLPDNVSTWRHFKQMLLADGILAEKIPAVLQYNRRDDKDVLPITVLQHALNEYHVPEHEAVAVKSIGVMETLQLLARQLVEQLTSKGQVLEGKM